MIRCIFLILTLMIFHFFPGGDCTAGELMTIRFVEASNDNNGIAKELKDVGPILTTQLPFKSYRVIDKNQCKLPANRTIKMARGYSLLCKGSQDNLTVNVKHRESDVLQATVELKDGKPLMLGGFPSNKGKLLLILLAK